MELNIKINSNPYDAEHFIVFFSKNGHGLGFELLVCEFDQNMRYLGYDCKVNYIDGKTGFIFHNSTKKDDIIFEIERFVRQYKIGD